MSARTTDHEAVLRAALHAAVDSLEPNGDGLERIRARLRQPRPASARLRAICSEIIMRVPAWLQDGVYQLADWARLVSERFAVAQAPGRHRSRTQGLLRPLAAMAVVMFIVAAGTYVAIDASTGIFPSSSSNAPAGGGPNAGGHSGAASPGPSHNGNGTVTGTGSHAHAPAPSASCRPTAPAGSTTTPAPQQSPSTGPAASPPDTSASVDPSASPAAASASPAASNAASPAPSVNAPTTTQTTPLAKSSPGC